jgi:hypothetical protein
LFERGFFTAKKKAAKSCLRNQVNASESDLCDGVRVEIFNEKLRGIQRPGTLFGFDKVGGGNGIFATISKFAPENNRHDCLQDKLSCHV